MRRLVLSMAVGLALASGCGGDSGGGDDPGGDTGGANTGSSSSATAGAMTIYPDSLCDADGCDKGGCDPDGKDEAMPDCNAWQILGNFALQVAEVNQDGKLGFPPPAERSDDDLCPPNTKSPAGLTEHCCQPTDQQSDLPTFRLTALKMNTPPIFGGDQVSSTNKDAIEDDRYDWIMQVSSAEDGETTIKSGLGLHNTDGTLQFADGPFELGGETWNENGNWDPHMIPATLSTNEDGTRKLSYKGQFVPKDHPFELPMWGKGYDFTMLVLSMSGIEMSIDISEDLLCAGYLKGPKTFDMVGQMTSYLPLDKLKEAILHFRKGDSGLALCELTAQVPPGTCDKPVKDW